MRTEHPFQPEDLEELGTLLDRADDVVAMEDVYRGDTRSGAIGMRHDVDNVIAPAVAMAEWEAERGYRSTYFILHTAPYWHHKEILKASLEAIADCDHEIGFHVNAITQAIHQKRDPLEIVQEALDELRGYGYPVRGVVAHGDKACYQHDFVNDEIFVESIRHDHPYRTIGGIKLNPVPRFTFGLEYDPNWLPRDKYLSDSGGRWSQPFETIAAGYPYQGQLHMLVHADWWGQAFHGLEVAA